MTIDSSLHVLGALFNAEGTYSCVYSPEVTPVREITIGNLCSQQETWLARKLAEGRRQAEGGLPCSSSEKALIQLVWTEYIYYALTECCYSRTNLSGRLQAEGALVGALYRGIRIVILLVSAPKKTPPRKAL